ncbi:RidA family protein [Roseococcus sp. DSY-14]|uniref:RidA family protein n=1 Tax=Roseococcus sp. DSY-14 TaxID=3369650 RepID=UPI00387B935F
MTRRLISSGSVFEEQIGYSRAVVDGEWVFVSGTTGYDYATMTIADDVAAQCEQALRNIEAALAQAGGSLRDVVRATFIVPRREDWAPCWPVLKRFFGEVRPASTLLHAGLQTDAMRIEIEVTARLRRREGEQG